MSTCRRTLAALAATALPALAVAPSAHARSGPDPERISERVTGVPRPAAPVPGLGSARSAAVPDATLRARRQSRSQALVPTFGGRVADVGSGATVWSRGSTTGMRPASATKVLTATSALKVLGPGHRYATTVMQSQSARDHVYLKGSGDPTLSSARLDSLAHATARSVKAQGITTVTLRVDDSLFPAPTNAVGWEREDVP